MHWINSLWLFSFVFFMTFVVIPKAFGTALAGLGFILKAFFFLFSILVI
jgi:hypothetical protein